MSTLVAQNRIKQGKNPSSTYGIIDSQTVKTTSNSNDRGIDGGKKIKGRKRHIVVDTCGHILHLEVHRANLNDGKEGCRVFAKTLEKFPTLQAVSADGVYRGTFVDFVAKTLKKTAHIAKRIDPKK